MRSKPHNIVPPVALMPFKSDADGHQQTVESCKENKAFTGKTNFKGDDIRSWDPDTLIVLDRSEPEDESHILDETLQVDSAFFSQSRALQPVQEITTLNRVRIYKSATARVRFLARAFDLYWQIALLQIGVLKAFEIWQPALVLPPLDNFKAQLAVIFLLLPVALIIDSLCCTLFGNTPGKALLGVKVFSKDKSRVSLWRILRRNTSFWFYGLACGLPGFQLYTFMKQFARTRALKRTQYDRKLGLWVGAKRSSTSRVVSFVMASIVVVLSVQIGTQGSSVNQHITATLPEVRRTVTQSFLDHVGISKYLTSTTISNDNAQQATKTPNLLSESLWNNPATQLSTEINQNWLTSAIPGSSDGYRFDWRRSDNPLVRVSLKADKSGLVTASEIGRNYVGDTTHQVDFNNTAFEYEYDGRSYWEYRGHLSNEPSAVVILQIARLDTDYWIIETVLNTSDKTLDEEAEKLSAAIWATL